MTNTVGDNKHKLTATLTVPEGGLTAATPTFLNAGFQLCDYTLQNGFELGPTGSESINEPSLCSGSNASTPGASNYSAAFTLFRQYSKTGGIDVDTEVEKFLEAIKVKGTEVTLWGRKTDKAASEPWETGDEVYAAVTVVVDDLQSVHETGFIKARVPTFPQKGATFFKLGADTPAG